MNHLQKHIADIITETLNGNLIFSVPKKDITDLAKAVIEAVDEDRKEAWEARNEGI